MTFSSADGTVPAVVTVDLLSSDLTARLGAPGPKRILSLDGGGTRGVVSLAFLRSIEHAFGESGPACLADHFDLIGGTSTGAIVAAALALGWRVADIEAMYASFAGHVFRRQWFRVSPLLNRYSAAPLEALLEQHFGRNPAGETLTVGDKALRTGLAIITKRVDTGSPWIVSNLPGAPYYDDRVAHEGEKTPPNGNRRIPLKDLVRASVAAPTFFRPLVLPLGPGADGAPETGVFVDGGASPYNNPALALLQLVRFRAFGLDWPTGPDQLQIVSVGTGRFRLRQTQHSAAPGSGIAGLRSRITGWSDRLLLLQAIRTLQGVVGDGGVLALTLLRALGTSPQDASIAPDVVRTINSEVGDLVGECLGREPLFTLLRYDIDLERPPSLSDRELRELRRLDAPEQMPALRAMAEAAASEQVRREDLMFAGCGADAQ